MRRKLCAGAKFDSVEKLLAELKLETVCVSARCPNRSECFCSGTATFLILGDICTRNCSFCAVAGGQPKPPRSDEPAAIAEAAVRLELKHVVITSVTRDDLPDGGAAHFAETIRAVRSRLGESTVEVLTPDFQGDLAAVDTVLAAGPDVFNHNIETIERLYPQVRPQADYRQSLAVLAHAGRDNGTQTKSGLMLGLGETDAEIGCVLEDLRAAGVTLLTLGQYLAPSKQHAKIDRFVSPEQFDELRIKAEQMGFAAVAAGPYVRSSYRADKLLQR